MKQLHRIIVQVHRPTEGYVGQVEEGQYTFEDGVVTLTSPTGVPEPNKLGGIYTKTLADGEDAHTIAGRLLKQRWHDRGGDRRSFSAPIHYPDLGIV